MRIRTIKPSFWKSRDIRRLDFLTRLLYIGLWNFADDAGRFEHDPDVIQGDLFPSDTIDIVRHLGELRRRGLIFLYVVDDEEYMCIPTWFDHQRINRPQLPRTPELPEIHGTFPRSFRNIPCRRMKKTDGRERGQKSLKGLNLPDDKEIDKFTEDSLLEGKGREGKGRERKGRERKGKCMSPKGDDHTQISSSQIEEILKAYPKVTAPARAKKAILAAFNRLLMTDKENPTAFLLERVEAFAASPKGRSRFIPAPARFMDEERYYENPSAWADGDNRNESAADRRERERIEMRKELGVDKK